MKFFIFLIIFSYSLSTNKSNFCRISQEYETSLSNKNFEIIYLTITIKNNNYSFNNTKNIKSVIALSKTGSTNSWFKILTVHRDSLIPNTN